MTKNLEEREDPLNNQKLDTPSMNKGFELLLRNKKRREPPKTFQFKFGKMVSLLSREIHFFLDIQFDIRKKES
tara:strand:- start:969 stop:1187 length:219 start_codon:yes stop_codon:yes gene_type:complete